MQKLVRFAFCREISMDGVELKLLEYHECLNGTHKQFLHV